uniref:zinc-binding protein A33-like isoform X2 n=1 Tax=Pristiophorus japonicus TaxID=55135 RepID=UPI00398E727B
MASSEQNESWTDETICSICLDFFTDPVILECGHNFCRSCITQCWEKMEINSCPECREEFPEINLRVSRALASLAEKARKFSLNQKEKQSKLHCEEHQEELKLFCETDKKLICYTCIVAREHREHRFMPIKEAVGIYKVQVKSSLDSLTEKKSAVLEIERQQKQKIFEEQSSSLQTHITSEFAKMHQILTEKEQCLIRDLREQEERILEPMEENLRQIQENLNSVQEKLTNLQEQMDQKDGLIFLKEETHQTRRIGEDSKELKCVDANLSIEKFNSPLPYPVWREMLDAINPVSVTLDVETANRVLEVSEDLKSVRRIRTRRNLPDTEERFTAWACVLGLEGFTSGRHYWEVDVAGTRIWSLGVAAESVERKGKVELILENGLWTIGLDEDEFNVNSSPPSPLPANQIPRKVGVYLSYESGTVSFYSADTKSHLHTFTGNKFTEKLYPFFRTGDVNKWLRICSGSVSAL